MNFDRPVNFNMEIFPKSVDNYLSCNCSMVKKIILFFLVCALFSFSVFAENTFPNFEQGIQSLSRSLEANHKEVKSVSSLIKTFCSVVLNSPWFLENDFFYSAKQSSFVYLLCTNVDPELIVSLNETLPKWFSDDKQSWFFKSHSFEELWFVDMRLASNRGSSLVNYCSPKTDMSQCLLGVYVPQLYHDIVADYIQLKQLNLFGFSPWLAADASANLFSKKYFSGLEVCSSVWWREYPSTCKVLKKYITDSQRLVSDLTVLRSSAVFDADLTDVCDYTKNTYNLVVCWLFGQRDTSLQPFLNLVYNELFYFRLFGQYYSWMISNKQELLKLPTITSANNEIFSRTSSMANEFIWSQDALSLSLRMLRDFYSSFPLHIGFLLYQEDIISLSQPLASLFTPLSQLYYLFQDVQKK